LQSEAFAGGVDDDERRAVLVCEGDELGDDGVGGGFVGVDVVDLVGDDVVGDAEGAESFDEEVFGGVFEVEPPDVAAGVELFLGGDEGEPAFPGPGVAVDAVDDLRVEHSESVDAAQQGWHGAFERAG
jgi:hypothetical protein